MRTIDRRLEELIIELLDHRAEATGAVRIRTTQ